MMNNYLITKSNSENAAIKFMLFNGTEDAMLQRFLTMARAEASEMGIEEDNLPEDITDIDYNEYDNTWCIILYDEETEVDIVFTAIDMNNITFIK